MVKQGNQATLNNGCVCDSGCEACDRLAREVEGLRHFAAAFPSRSSDGPADAFKRYQQMAEAFEAMREALRAVMTDVEIRAGKRGTYDGDHKISGYAQGQSRAALTLADKVKR